MSGPRQRYRAACGATVRLHGSPSNWTIDARPLRLSLPRARSIRFAPDPPRLMVWSRDQETPQEIPPRGGELVSHKVTVGFAEAPALGPCCNCGSEEDVTCLVMLDITGPVIGQGWGCCVCGLPADGAIAVLCDACAPDAEGGSPAVTNICVGYPGLGLRRPLADWQPQARPHEHDLVKHAQDDEALAAAAARTCRVCGCTEVTPCLDGIEPCHWAEADLCSACQGSDHG